MVNFIIIYFSALPRLYISITIEQLTNKVQVFVRRKQKNAQNNCQLYYLSKTQMNSDKIMDGTVGFRV